LLAVLAVALSSAGAATAAPPPTLLWGVAVDGRVLQFTSSRPDRVQVVLLRGIPAGERVLALDVRPADGKLYAATSANRIYSVEVATRRATAVGSTPFEVGLESARVDMDINPASDRIRFITDTNENLRVNPADGATARRGGQLDVDGRPAYAEDDPGAGTTPRITAVAHTNNRAGVPLADSKVLVIDVRRDTLGELVFPNRGGLRTVGPLGLDVLDPAGFDITPAGDAFAALQPAGSPTSGLYTIDAGTGAATRLGAIGGGTAVGSIAALGAATELPAFAVRIASVSAARIGIPVTVRIACTQACEAAATLRLGSAAVAAAPRASLGAGGSLRLTYSAAGRKRLAKLGKVRLALVVTATGSDGTSASVRRRILVTR
jgi:hypothetical protein